MMLILNFEVNYRYKTTTAYFKMLQFRQPLAIGSNMRHTCKQKVRKIQFQIMQQRVRALLQFIEVVLSRQVDRNGFCNAYRKVCLRYSFVKPLL